jgi:hypothetical protein
MHLLSLKTFCDAVRKAGFDVALTAIPATVIAERAQTSVFATFNRDGSVTMTSSGLPVTLADLTR